MSLLSISPIAILLEPVGHLFKQCSKKLNQLIIINIDVGWHKIRKIKFGKYINILPIFIKASF